MKMTIEAHYISPLSRVQRLESTRSIENIFRFLAETGVANFAPAIYDNFNWDELLRSYAKLHNCPNNLFLTEAEVNRIRNMRAEQKLMQANEEARVNAN